MMLERLDLWIPGPPVPQPKARKLARGNYGVPRDHPVHAWRDLIALTARHEMDGPEPWLDPVELLLAIRMVRPAKRTHARKAMPAYWHTAKPDTKNILTAVEDALTGIVWRDDAQVCRHVLEKYVPTGVFAPYLGREGVRIIVTRLPFERGSS